jgi:hypothetical protein
MIRRLRRFYWGIVDDLKYVIGMLLGSCLFWVAFDRVEAFFR